MNGKILSVGVFLLVASFASANMGVSVNQIVAGQAATINAECMVGTSCSIYRDGVLVFTGIGDAFGTLSFVDVNPPLGVHTYSWTGMIYGYAGLLQDHAFVTVVVNNADELQGHSYADILADIASGDFVVLNAALANDQVILDEAKAYADAGDARIWAGIEGLDKRLSKIEGDVKQIKSDLYTIAPTHTFDELKGVYYKPFSLSSSEQAVLDAPVSRFEEVNDALANIQAGGPTGVTVENCVVVPAEIKFSGDLFGRLLVACVAEPRYDSELTTFPFTINEKIGDNANHYILARKEASGRTQWFRVDAGEWAGVLSSQPLPQVELSNSLASCERVGLRLKCGGN